MHYTIAGRRYVVVIFPRQITRNGIVRQAWFDASGFRILIAADVSREDRRRLLFHELRHAWTEIHGLPKDSEGDATSVGVFMDSMLEQFEAQGGAAAIALLDPPAEAMPERRTAHVIRDRQSCGCCNAEVMCGSIENGAPRFHEGNGCFVVPRWIPQCDACGSFTAWFETCTEAGEPLGTFLAFPPPRVLDAAGRKKWLAEHTAVLCG